MKRVLAGLASLWLVTPLFAQPVRRYLIAMRTAPAVSSLRLARDMEASVAHNVRTFRNLDFIAADLTDVEAAALRGSRDVRYVSAVVPRSLSDSGTPVPSHLHTRQADGHFAHAQTVAYGIDMVHARDVWPLTRGAGNVNVAILDTGLDYTHPDLKNAYQGGYNTFTNSNDPMDDHGHGTHVAGIIGAADNTIGVVGVAPAARIWSVKVLQANGAGTDESVMAGVDWVISKKKEIGGNWVMNLSLGSRDASDPERATFARAIDNGILVVAAAGNHGLRGLDYPAAYDQVLAISALDSHENIADFSSFGPGVGFAAPGVDVLSTFRVGVLPPAAEIDTGTTALASAQPLDGSSLGEFSADTVYCGTGKPGDFPSNTSGKIALITRGELQFREKVRNAKTAGAIAIVIVPTVDDPARLGWTLLVDPADAAFTWPVVVSTSAREGQTLIDNAGKGPITVSYSADDYAFLSGTSMATPHVTGVAALVWSLAPNTSAADIRLALKLSADDLGAKDYDELFGYGQIDALSGAKYVAPGLFGLPPTPPPKPTRRRGSSPQPHT